MARRRNRKLQTLRKQAPESDDPARTYVEVLRRLPRRDRRVRANQPGRGCRIPRAERRGQDDHHACAHRLYPTDRGNGSYRRVRRGYPFPGRSQAHRLPSGICPSLPGYDRNGLPPLHGTAPWNEPPMDRRTSSGHHRHRPSRRIPECTGRKAIQGIPAEGGDRTGDHPRA